MKEIPYWGITNIRQHRAKFSGCGNLTSIFVRRHVSVGILRDSEFTWVLIIHVYPSSIAILFSPVLHIINHCFVFSVKILTPQHFFVFINICINISILKDLMSCSLVHRYRRSYRPLYNCLVIHVCLKYMWNECHMSCHFLLVCADTVPLFFPHPRATFFCVPTSTLKKETEYPF
jgi:hypothetical protein